MEKREKIIVAIAIAAAIYGALDFLVFSKMNDSPELSASSADAEILTSITTQLSGQSFDSKVLDNIRRIKTPWPEKVFFNKSAETLFEYEDKKVILEQLNPEQFSYTGYLEMGNNKIAIINGTDYTLGESINGATITGISQEKIEISIEGERLEVPIKPAEEVRLDSQQYIPLN